MIKIKLLDILEKDGRNLNWLSNNAGITYSTLYNFAHQKTNSVTYDILEKLCTTLRCTISDIIEFIPEEDAFANPNIDVLEKVINLYIEARNDGKSIGFDDEFFIYDLFKKTITGDGLQHYPDVYKALSLCKKCFNNGLISKAKSDHIMEILYPRI